MLEKQSLGNLFDALLPVAARPQTVNFVDIGRYRRRRHKQTFSRLDITSGDQASPMNNNVIIFGIGHLHWSNESGIGRSGGRGLVSASGLEQNI